MRALVISINYAPESTGFAPHVASLCEYLTIRSHVVTVITGFPFAPHWNRWPEYRGHFIASDWLRRVNIIRVSHFIPKHPGKLLERIWMEFTFCLTAIYAIAAHWRQRWEIVLYVGAQPSIAMLIRYIAYLKKIPYVININDLASQAAKDVGIVKSNWIQRAMTAFEYFAYKNAAGAMVLCSAFQEALIMRGFPENRIRVIPSPTDIELVRPLNDRCTFRSRHNLSENDFVILYSGSMGLKQGLTNVVKAAFLLQEVHSDVKWILVGDGELKQRISYQIRMYNLKDTMRLLPLQLESQMSLMFSAADLLLLNQISNVKDTVIPSKLLTYMAAGRPIIAAINFDSQAAKLLREANGGLIVSPDDPISLAEGVKQIKTDSKLLAELGGRNRAYAEQHFDCRKIVAAQELFLLEILQRENRSK